jgi:hypothetical protein
MLDLKLELRNSAGALMTSADTASLGENITATLAAGTYYVVVASHGSYGDIGQYSLSATLASGTPSAVNKTWVGPASGGSWSSSSNWSPAGIPDADDRVTIADASVTLFSDVTIGALTITGAGALDVRGHSLVIDYADVGPLERWDGTGYTGMSGLIARGALRSSLAEVSNLLAAAEASDALSLSTTATATWSGQTVDGSSVLVKLSIGGDSNLDGNVNVDDYGRIDAAVQSALAGLGWFDGDFNFDGKINIDDYGIIDGNINQQDEVL